MKVAVSPEKNKKTEETRLIFVNNLWVDSRTGERSSFNDLGKQRDPKQEIVKLPIPGQNGKMENKIHGNVKRLAKMDKRLSFEFCTKCVDHVDMMNRIKFVCQACDF